MRKYSLFMAGAWVAVAVVSLLFFIAGDKETLMEAVMVALAPASVLTVAALTDPE